MKLKRLSTTIALIAGAMVPGLADNPIVQTYYTADPAPMVHDGTVYVYTSHDEDTTIRNFFTMNDWKCYSSKDMVNWTDHGSVFSYKGFDWSRGDAWAGQCVYRNGKYYYYVPVNMKNGGNAIGVGVSDSPTGPFKDAIGKPLLIGYGYIDPTVFIDDDGQAYLYWGNPNLWYVKLNKDMLSYDQQTGIVKVPLNKEGFNIRLRDVEKRPSAYEEGPWMYKRNKQYYLLYPAGGVPEHLAYSTAPTITGPWTYQDTIMHVIQKGGAFTNHPGLIDFKGKSYLFYHNGALRGGGGFKRSVCIEEFKFNPDGTIPLIEPTREGVKESVQPLNPFKRVEAETMAWGEGLKTYGNSTNGVYVSEIDPDDYIKIKSVNFNKVATQFTATVSKVQKGSSIEIRIGSPSGKLIGTCALNADNQKKFWFEQSCTLQQTKGIQDVYLVFKGTDKKLFDLDSWILK
jgi:arabinoxylan arabinofuranohydrolase